MDSKKITLMVAIISVVGLAKAKADSNQPIMVQTTEELVAAMAPENAGRTILIKAGIYEPEAPLKVPPRARVIGEGVMRFDSERFPDYLEAAPVIRPLGKTTPFPVPSDHEYFGEEIMEISDGASIRGVKIDNNVLFTNTLRIFAQGGQALKVSILESEILGPGGTTLVASPKRPGFLAQVGRPLYISTGDQPPIPDPEGDPIVEVSLSKSIVDAKGGPGQSIFVLNHETRGHVGLTLQGNRVKRSTALATAAGPGTNVAPVNDASMDIFSRQNLYEGLGAAGFSIGFLANTGAPAPVAGTTIGSSRNQLRFSSYHDKLKDFTLAIWGLAAQRRGHVTEDSEDNRLDMELIGTTITGTGLRDLTLCATVPFVGPDGNGNVKVTPPGPGNILTALIRQINGSGNGDDVFETSCEFPFGQAHSDELDNVLEFLGTLEAWIQTNEEIDPPEEFFFK